MPPGRTLARLSLVFVCSACNAGPSSPSASTDFAGVWTGTLQITACTDMMLTPCRDGFLPIGYRNTVQMDVSQTGTAAHVKIWLEPSTFTQASGEADADVSRGTLAFRTNLTWTSSRSGGSEVLAQIDWTSHLEGDRHSMSGSASRIHMVGPIQEARTTDAIAMTQSR